MLFLGSVFIGIINWTNIGTVVAIKLLELIQLFNFTGTPLVVISFIGIVLMCILLPPKAMTVQWEQLQEAESI